ncbi:MAG: ATP-binding cassette domain-containing protein [Methanotrichaceae archaeon]|nr:ATP-binding cassette domain-containing protein [Methanotrichaceae archaeon]
MDGPAIALRSLTKRFKGLVAVDEIDLEIEKGELFGLLGPNGAGKSTIIKMLTTMLKPTSGSAIVWGHDVVGDRDAVRSSVGVVFQDPTVDTMLTARENLDFHGRMYGMDAKRRRQGIEEVLDLVDLSDKADVLVEEFSGGMRRRLEIARGLMHRPHVLFLDEPTLGLDSQTRRHIWQYIREMNLQEEVTVVLTTHYMEEADNLCKRVAIIDNGRIVALNSPENLKDLIGADIINLSVLEGHDDLLQALEPQGWIRSIQTSNGEVQLHVDHAQVRMPEIMTLAYRNGVGIESVSMHEPTLEDVFLKFTGRKIRAEGGAGAAARMGPWRPRR